MKKITILSLFCVLISTANAQSVTTYAGITNDDADNNYESTSGKDLLDTYFSNPTGLCFDNTGKMYISEKNKIRIISNGKLQIRSGSLQQPALSEGYRNATATQSTYRNPGGMATDADGNVYIADVANHCIRRLAKYVNLGNGQVASTFAGAAPTPGLPGFGTAGSSDGTGTSARFDQPTDIAVDTDGNFYVTDNRNYTIRKITPAGVVTTLAGTAKSAGTADGTGAAAKFGRPWGVAIYNSNTIVVTDPWNTNIRKINIYTGATTTLAGPNTGTDARIVDGTLTNARFKAPKGIAVVDGIIYVADQNVIRAINETNNSVTTFAGNVSEFAVKDGSGSNATFTELADLETDGLGNLYATENSIAVSSHVIRKITISALVPAADFEASTRTCKVNDEVTITDISGGEPATSRTWTITPADYTINSGTISSAELKVAFTKTGFYDVKLVINNSFGSDTKIGENYIAVSTTGSVTKYKDNKLMTIYPNPANDKVNIVLDPTVKRENAIIAVYTALGNKVLEVQPREQLNTRSLENGNYFVTFSSGDNHLVKRLSIAHK
ncbi:MAG: T9SS type A sorting domain-containing protein [Bacteroidia bacterium]